MSEPVEFSSLHRAYQQVLEELSKVLVAYEPVIEQLMIGLLAKGHCLFEAPPGTAKALSAASLARVLGLSFDCIRCTPDLRPQDIVGLGAAPTGSLEVPGPIFSQLVLVDDIGRLAPRTDALLQQAIQEARVVLDGRSYRLAEPFMLLATEYPLVAENAVSAERSLAAEHHDDRFFLKIALGYPEQDDEFRLAEQMSSVESRVPEPVVGPHELMEFRQLLGQVTVSPPVLHYIVRLVRATRIHEGETPDFIYEWVDFGAGPRATHHLTLAAKARAALHGQQEATVDDVRAVAHPVLRHRITTNRNARSTGVTVDRVIRRLLYEIPERDEGDELAPSPRAG